MVAGICVEGVAGICVAGVYTCTWGSVVVYDELKSQVLINVLEDAPSAYSVCDINRTIINMHVQHNTECIWHYIHNSMNKEYNIMSTYGNH